MLITLLLAFLGLRRVALATDSALCLVHPNVGSALIRLGGVCSRGVPRLATVGDDFCDPELSSRCHRRGTVANNSSSGFSQFLLN